MPPRWLSASIVVFWLGTTGWLCYQEVWPLLLPGQAPPFTIDLEDEVQTQQAHIRWVVLYNDRPYRSAETWVEPNPADDTFALTVQIRPRADLHEKAGEEPLGGLIRLQRLLGVYRVSRKGDLRSIAVELTVETQGVPVEGSLAGEIRDGLFHPHVHASTPLLPGQPIEKDLAPVAVSGHGSVLSPLHPVNRIEGLRRGQTWRAPLVDPIKDVLKVLATGQAGEEVVLTARVLPETQTLTWNGRPVECLVVEYQGDELSAKTWVQVGTGLVLRQESEHDGERLAFQRE